MHGGGGMGSLRGLMHDLDLTDEQRTQLRTVARSGWEQSAARRAELDSLRKQVEATVIANGFDEAEVRGLIEARSALLTESMVDVVRAMAEMRSVLTPEQQKLFDERRAEAESRRSERKARRSGKDS
jgi:Spy/CpxP family protein refolding chaperone